MAVNITKQNQSVLAAILTCLTYNSVFWDGIWCISLNGFEYKCKRWYSFRNGKKRDFCIKACRPKAWARGRLWGGGWGWASQLAAPAAQFAHQWNVLLHALCWFCQTVLLPKQQRSLALPCCRSVSLQQLEPEDGAVQARVQRDAIILAQGTYYLRSK